MEDTRTIFFLGKPGCGKGTQANILSKRTQWPVISAGAQLRKIATEDSFLGHKIKKEIDAGMLVPPWFATYLYQKALFVISDTQSVIFDGFNRRPEETQLVVDSLSWIERSFSVINLVISDELVWERVKRRSHNEKRADDESIKTRLEEYYTYTDKALEIFRTEGVLIDIDGAQEPDVVAESVATAIQITK